MSDTAYIVFGECGEYSDWRYWTVAAYDTEEEADQHRDAANKWAKDHGLHRDSYDHEHRELANPWDKNMSMDYTGVDYSVEAVPKGGYPHDPPRCKSCGEQSTWWERMHRGKICELCGETFE